jgi:hypothetical protein
MDDIFKCKIQNGKVSKENIEENKSDLGFGYIFKYKI